MNTDGGGLSSSHRGMREDLPYVLVYTELQEGVLLPSNIVDCPPAVVSIDMAVQVVVEDVTPELALSEFKPVAS